MFKNLKNVNLNVNDKNKLGNGLDYLSLRILYNFFGLFPLKITSKRTLKCIYAEI